MNDKFNLEYQYNLFLKMMKLDESKMHPQQKIQLKQTFFGAWGQLLMLLRDDVSELSEKQGIEKLESMTKQISLFFAEEMRKQN